MSENQASDVGKGRVHWSRAIKIALSAVMFVLIFMHVGWARLVGELRELSVFTLVVSVGIASAGTILSIGKWQTILRAQGFVVPFRRLLRIYFVCWFFSMVTIGGAGGYVYRVWALSRDTKSTGVAGATLVVDRIADLAGATLLVIAGLGITAPMFGAWQVALGAIGLAVLFAVAGYVLLGGGSGHVFGLARFLPAAWGRRLARVAEDFGTSANRTGRSGSLWCRILVLSVAFHLSTVFLNYTVADLQGWNVPWRYFFAFIPLVGLVSLLPLTVNGIGLNQWLYVYLFSGVGLGPQRALLLSLLILAITVTWGLVGGVVYALTAEPAADPVPVSELERPW
ncbi:MAG: flippase-like domain-containing protein [Candidatus Rokubacteria bacterium]|nr:flippase-like domain-containing protein [Candidatus Rokubacteria bacterium]